MAAAEKTIRTEAREKEAAICRECLGTGVLARWSEVAYFEDRRTCPRCEAGFVVDSKIGDIVRRAQLEERLAGR